MKSAIEKTQTIIDKYFVNQSIVSVLEAGCGSGSNFRLPPTALVTGIDISARQLERNKLLNNKILGDIQNHELPSSSFDIIICYHVLEHLKLPNKAINNFFKAIKKNGFIILAAPNPLSLKGLATKFSPHWFHVFIYRFIYGKKDAGKDDKAPFKTFMRFSITPKAIKRLAENNKFRVELLEMDDAINYWVGNYFKDKSVILFYSIKLFQQILKTISFGMISDSEYIMVLRKVGRNHFYNNN